MAIEFLDNFFRFGAISFLLWAVFLLLRYFPHTIQARLAMGAGIGVAAMLFVSVNDEVAIVGPVLGPILVHVAEFNIAFTWLFCLSLFRDNFRMQPLHWLVLAAYGVMLVSFEVFPDADTVHLIVSRALRVLIYGYLIYIVIADRQNDLIERRRRFRLWFVTAVIVATAIISLAEIYDEQFYDDFGGRLLQSIVIFMITVGLLAHISEVSGEIFFASLDARAPANPQSDETSADKDLGVEDRHSLEKLQALMDSGTYAEPGLTISLLSERVRIPEHRLRRLINHHLGHRNFSQYLNAHRIAAAEARLAAVDERHVPILTIAMDVGYLSLGPFNRAFKNKTGLTPSEYRRINLEEKITS